MSFLKFYSFLTKQGLLLFTVLAFGQALSSCANSLNEEEKTVDMSYQFKENQCDTTPIKYTSAEDLCAKLKDSQLNHYCAERLRYDEFQKKCPNQQWN
jgi:hypothetical protein